MTVASLAMADVIAAKASQLVDTQTNRKLTSPGGDAATVVSRVAAANASVHGHRSYRYDAVCSNATERVPQQVRLAASRTSSASPTGGEAAHPVSFSR